MREIIKTLNERLDAAQPDLHEKDMYWEGTQPASFMAPEARAQLKNRMSRLSVNFPKLAVTSLSERLHLSGFTVNGESKPEDLMRAWKKNRMAEQSSQAHLDALIYGRSYVIVWANDRRQPQVTVESPVQVTVAHHPVTREVTAGFKRWEEDGYARAVLYEPHQITLLRGGRVHDESYSGSWETANVLANPLGVVPVVPIVNKSRLRDQGGRSEMQDLFSLSDALNKIMGDALVTSESYARPRRWVTGLELVEDEDGNVIEPFSEEASKLWISESTETKFGSFDGATLAGYPELVAVLTQQMGAIAGLPPHYMGLNGDQPASADGIRSAEASLVSRCHELIVTFGGAWEQVAALMLAVLRGRDVDAFDVRSDWNPPETRNAAQEADALQKLDAIDAVDVTTTPDFKTATGA